MGVGEEVDELADGIVGRDSHQQVTLTEPTLRQLVAGHLHPHGVDGVGRHRANIGHHEMVAVMEDHGIDHREHRHRLVARHHFRREDIGHRHHLRLLLQNFQGVAAHHEIVALGVVVSGVERDGIELPLRQIPGIRRDGSLVVATR